MLCTFWIRNVLRTTTACNFSFLIWLDGSAPAAVASLLCDPPGQQIMRKIQCIATFLCAPASCFFWLFLFSDLLSLLLFSSLTLPTSAFPSVHIVGSLTSKFLLETMKFLAELSWIIQTRPGTYPLGLPDNAATTREKHAGSRKNCERKFTFREEWPFADERI